MWGYLGGAASARAGDEMSGPALLLLGFGATGSAVAGSAMVAALTIAAAVGGPVFGAVLDRSPRPERVLAAALAAYAVWITAIAVAVGHIALPFAIGIALAGGVFNPAVAGGWTSQLPRVVTGDGLARASALDAVTFGGASLAGPALAALAAGWLGARASVLAAALLVTLAVPAARALPRGEPARSLPGGEPDCSRPRDEPPGAQPRDEPAGAQSRPALRRQLAAGFAAIVARRALGRATATSVVSYAGIGMVIVCCPVLGQQRLGSPARGALMISAAAVVSLAANWVLTRRPTRNPDRLVLVSTLVLCASMAAAALAPGWLTMLAIALGGAGEGPQLTGVFAVRHREAPAAMRGQIFTTAASLKIGGLAAGTALAGLLAARSVTACLLTASATELCAAATYLLTSVKGSGLPRMILR
jgi:MFS family permease